MRVLPLNTAEILMVSSRLRMGGLMTRLAINQHQHDSFVANRPSVIRENNNRAHKKSKQPSTIAEIKPKDTVSTVTMSAPTDGAYDRWSLRDPSTIDYGCFSGSNNGSPPSGSSAAANDGDKKGFYITTAINYTNGPAHMGHAYEAATADAIARFARLNASGDGNDPTQAYFVTGADEHGEKIAKTAEKEGKEPIEICDKVCHRCYEFCKRCCCDLFCQVVCYCMMGILSIVYWVVCIHLVYEHMMCSLLVS